MDTLLELSKNRLARRVIRGLRLPIPMPPRLRRGNDFGSSRIFDDARVVVFSLRASAALSELATMLAPLGARVVIASQLASLEAFERAAEAWAEPLSVALTPPAQQKMRALVLDCLAIEHFDDLAAVYDFVHTWSRSMEAGGRVVLLAPAVGEAPATAALISSLDGFMRSLAKEWGRKGVTVNLLRIGSGAAPHMQGPLRFLLSSGSAFITGQPLSLSAPALLPSVSYQQAQAMRGRVALVTGGGRGIGLATARALSREGAYVVIVEHPGSEAVARQAALQLGGAYLLIDLASGTASSEICAYLQAQHGGVDIVVHNAGITLDKTISRMSRLQWERVLNINLKAAIDLTEELIAAQLLRQHSRVVVLSSVGGIAGNPGQTNYAASKSGLIGYVRSLASKEALVRAGITFNAVAPGLIETQMTTRMPVLIREAARRLSSLNQGGRPSDVAEAVTLLAMPWAGTINGQVLRVCGGALIGA